MTAPDSSAEDSEENDEVPHRPNSLRPDQVWVEYHPAARKQSEIFGTSTLDTESVPVPPPSSARANLLPWHPFRSREDFEQAEIFLRFDASNTHMDQQLDLNRRSARGGSSITLKNAAEVHATLARIELASAQPHKVCLFTAKSSRYSHGV